MPTIFLEVINRIIHKNVFSVGQEPKFYNAILL